MRRQIQVHFENGGQLAWHEDIPDEVAPLWLEAACERGIDKLLQQSEAEMVFCQDKETDRKFFFNLTKVTAIIMIKETEQKDLFERTYATEKGNIQENDEFKYQGNGQSGTSAEAGGRRCF